MILRQVIAILIVCSLLSPSAPAQEVFPNRICHWRYLPRFTCAGLQQTVVPITELKLIGLGIAGKFGTGLLLGPECRFIGTNYQRRHDGAATKIKEKKSSSGTLLPGR